MYIPTTLIGTTSIPSAQPTDGSSAPSAQNDLIFDAEKETLILSSSGGEVNLAIAKRPDSLFDDMQLEPYKSYKLFFMYRYSPSAADEDAAGTLTYTPKYWGI